MFLKNVPSTSRCPVSSTADQLRLTAVLLLPLKAGIATAPSSAALQTLHYDTVHVRLPFQWEKPNQWVGGGWTRDWNLALITGWLCICCRLSLLPCLPLLFPPITLPLSLLYCLSSPLYQRHWFPRSDGQIPLAWTDSESVLRGLLMWADNALPPSPSLPSLSLPLFLSLFSPLFSPSLSLPLSLSLHSPWSMAFRMVCNHYWWSEPPEADWIALRLFYFQRATAAAAPQQYQERSVLTGDNVNVSITVRPVKTGNSQTAHWTGTEDHRLQWLCIGHKPQTDTGVNNPATN